MVRGQNSVYISHLIIDEAYRLIINGQILTKAKLETVSCDVVRLDPGAEKRPEKESRVKD